MRGQLPITSTCSCPHLHALEEHSACLRVSDAHGGPARVCKWMCPTKPLSHAMQCLCCVAPRSMRQHVATHLRVSACPVPDSERPMRHPRLCRNSHSPRVTSSDSAPESTVAECTCELTGWIRIDSSEGTRFAKCQQYCLSPGTRPCSLPTAQPTLQIAPPVSAANAPSPRAAPHLQTQQGIICDGRHDTETPSL